MKFCTIQISLCEATVMYGKQNLQEQKILYVCFEVNRINFFNLSFGIVIVNVPKNNQCFDEMARKYC